MTQSESEKLYKEYKIAQKQYELFALADDDPRQKPMKEHWAEKIEELAEKIRVVDKLPSHTSNLSKP